MGQKRSAQACRYGLTGIALNALYWLLAAGIARWCRWEETAASGLAYALTAVLAYFFHRHFTFRSRNPMRAEMRRFTTVTVIGMILALLMPPMLPGSPQFGYAAVCVTAPLVNFLVYRSLVYTQSGKN